MFTLIHATDAQLKKMSATHTDEAEASDLPALIFINGLPAVGKHTIARLIHHKLNPDKDTSNLMNREANSTLLHNHLMIDLVAAIAPWHEARSHITLREQLVSWTLNALLEGPREPRTYIVTAQVQVDPERHREVELLEYINFAETLDIPFFWFQLVCSNEKEHISRLKHDARHYGKTKDPAKLLDDRTNPLKIQLTPLDIEESLSDYHAIASRYHVIDTARKKPDVVADEILRIVAGGPRNAVSGSATNAQKASGWTKICSKMAKRIAKKRGLL